METLIAKKKEAKKKKKRFLDVLQRFSCDADRNRFWKPTYLPSGPVFVGIKHPPATRSAFRYGDTHRSNGFFSSLFRLSLISASISSEGKGGAKGERNVSYNACSRDRPFKEPTPFPSISPRKEKK